MLESIRIRDYALIAFSEVEFAPGFNVFTGESGAGKSVLMSAVDLLLGGRADRGSIRSGCARAEVSGVFTVPDHLRQAVKNMLDELDIDFDESSGELCLRRVLTQSATKNYINDTSVGARLLTELGSLLMDRHGAGDQLSLLQPLRQMELLDRYGDLGKYQNACRETFDALRRLAAERKAFDALLPDQSEADHLSLMVEEIERVNPVEGEEEELAGRHRLASNARFVLAAAGELTALLDEGEDSVSDRLGTVYHRLRELEKVDSSSVEDLLAHCADLQNMASSLSREIAALAERVELDPEELNAIEERLSALHTLKRRYAPSVDALLEKLEDARKRLDDFERSVEKRKAFDQQETALKKRLAEECLALSKARKAASVKLVRELVDRLKSIGFDRAQLEGAFSVVPDSGNGCDHFELLFSANTGEELRPLRKIASSGELSRLMLAFKTVLADSDAVPTVVFDEIDMNIGGETANKVGAALQSLGKKRQILSISHLAQVASRADRHFLVEKVTENGRTFSHVRMLENPVEELARMLGGGSAALDHAATLFS